ncbi:hypothetical protein L1987_75986 [Smallanthus sonchifolius]|uniref:Uncharacterized protein n=1 Tax=Smallanthus sonchifolius TaxID=185202 RepID=A0ACB9ABD0_9ASTR|nr:hypothetical protein L1987_75986 [Smallanthus sonchifolius]
MKGSPTPSVTPLLISPLHIHLQNIAAALDHLGFLQSLITFSSTIWLPSNTTKAYSRLEFIDNLCSMQDFVEPISERDII